MLKGRKVFVRRCQSDMGKICDELAREPRGKSAAGLRDLGEDFAGNWRPRVVAVGGGGPPRKALVPKMRPTRGDLTVAAVVVAGVAAAGG